MALIVTKTLSSERGRGSGRKLANEIPMGMECVSSFVEGFSAIEVWVVGSNDRARLYPDYDRESAGGLFFGFGLPMIQTYKLCDFNVVTPFRKPLGNDRSWFIS